MGRKDLYEKYLRQFLQDTHIEDALRAQKEQNYSEMLEQTHALKGLAGTLGMTELFEISAEIVTDLRQNDTEKLQSKMEALRVERDRLLAAIHIADE